MMLPHDTPASVRDALRELDDRLQYLEKRAGSAPAPGVTPADLESMRDALRVEISRAGRMDFNEVYRGSGPVHAMGYVPDIKDSAAWDERVLLETGKWGFPLRGMLRPVTSQGMVGETRYSGDILQGLCSLVLIGNLSAAKAYLKDLRLTGNLDVQSGSGAAMRLFCPTLDPAAGAVVGNVTTGETTYVTYTFPAGTFAEVGGCGFEVTFRVALAANSNTKTIKVYVGSTSVTVFSATTSGGNIDVRMWVFRRSVSSAWILEGWSTVMSTGVTTVGAVSIAQDATLAFTAKATLTGGATNDLQAVGSKWIGMRAV